MTITVRPYTPGDAEAVRSICVSCAPHRIRTETKRLYLFKTACDYYLDCEPEKCLVAIRTDEEGRETVIGYAFAAVDCESYAKRMVDRYIPKLKEYGKMNAHFAKMDVMEYVQFANFFPAHIRLCVLPSERGQGAEEKLLQEEIILIKNYSGKGAVILVSKKDSAMGEILLKNGFSFVRKSGQSDAYGFDF